MQAKERDWEKFYGRDGGIRGEIFSEQFLLYHNVREKPARSLSTAFTTLVLLDVDHDDDADEEMEHADGRLGHPSGQVHQGGEGAVLQPGVEASGESASDSAGLCAGLSALSP